MPRALKAKGDRPIRSLALFTSPKSPLAKFKKRTKLHSVQTQKRTSNEPAKAARPAARQ